jgi:hypothetical protein
MVLDTTSGGQGLVPGLSPRSRQDRQVIEITYKAVVIGGDRKQKGDVVTVTREEADLLIGMNRARVAKVSEPVKSKPEPVKPEPVKPKLPEKTVKKE